MFDEFVEHVSSLNKKRVQCKMIGSIESLLDEERYINE